MRSEIDDLRFAQSPRHRGFGWLRLILFVLAAIGPTLAAAQNFIFVTDAGAPSGSTCTLAQAIYLADVANGATTLGSSTPVGACQTIPPPIIVPPPGSYTLYVIPTQITLTTIDNYWYGPNALPPITCDITIEPAPGNAYLQIMASHVGDPTPSTSNAFRFFYVAGWLEIHGGSLTLQNVILQGGYAKGGDSMYGGGGAGMGGAIFNEGTLALANVSLLANVAQGGASGIPYAGAYLTEGGGMGEDATGSAGGGFGGGLGASFGGTGGVGGASFGGGGGGGGFVSGANGGNGNGNDGGAGGGLGGLGGAGGECTGSLAGPAGDGGGGGSGGGGGGGGAFGTGGVGGGSGGGGGGVGGGGGGGGGCGGGGGFAGGGAFGYSGGIGGFGGGGGAATGGFVGSGGFGGGSGNSSYVGGGGAGMGGAIFNHRGSISMVNVTATGNAAKGGTSGAGSGSGLGAVLFNLNGTVTIDFSTIAGNSVANSSAGVSVEDGSVYSLAFGNDINTGAATSAALNINNSIIRSTHADAAGYNDDVVLAFINAAHTNSASVHYVGANMIQNIYRQLGVTVSGATPSTADPLLGPLTVYHSSPLLLPVLPTGMSSPAQYAASTCYLVDGSTALTTDERGATRPYNGVCYLGAYQFDGDYIFAANNEPRL
jgi:hypothetical protein